MIEDDEKMSVLYPNEVILTILLQQFDAFIGNASKKNVWMWVHNGAPGAKEPRSRVEESEEAYTTIAQVYIRKSYRGSHRGPHRYKEITCLEIASIEITEEYEGRGLFRSFVTETHLRHPYRMTYIQSVENPIIEQWCIKHGWSRDPLSDPPSFFLAKEIPIGAQEMLLHS